MKIVALCDKDTAVGLMLAGIKEYFIPKGNAADLWKQISERDDIGVVFITESVADDISRFLDEYRIRSSLPIVVEIPDKKGRKTDHVDYISHLIKKAVGVEVSK